MQVEIKATLWVCAKCRAPMIMFDGEVKQRVTIWGTPDAPLITPHTDDCVSDTPPFEKISWGVGLFADSE